MRYLKEFSSNPRVVIRLTKCPLLGLSRFERIGMSQTKRRTRRSVVAQRGSGSARPGVGAAPPPPSPTNRSSRQVRIHLCKSRNCPAHKYMPFAKLLVAALCFIGAVWLAVKLTASGGGSAPTVRTAGSKITAHFQAHHKVGVRQQLMITACERRGHPDAFSLSDRRFSRRLSATMWRSRFVLTLKSRGAVS